jgi:bifunctional DNA-binding transcriptional regulator/antitoxin component of YhaV-PrlF toxin-antitoxin module
MASQVTVIEHGQLPLTREIQEALGMTDGSSVSLTIEDGRIIVEPYADDPIRAMQDLFQGATYSLADELMEMRREEEEHSHRKYGC